MKNIGTIAGSIYNYLSTQEGTTTVATLRKKLELKPEQAAFSIGWLAREDKVEMFKSGNSLKIKLK